MDKIKILFVEDEPDIETIVELALARDASIELAAFSTATEALAAIDLNDDRFEYALLNVVLPSMTGPELHKELRRRPGMETLRTVLITASVGNLNDPSFHLPGIVGVISKPFDPLKLAIGLPQMLESYERDAI